MARSRHSTEGGKSPAGVSRSTSRRKAILVLGMHLSETSVFTCTLRLLAADLPSDLMPPWPGNNETGFWEGTDIRDIHDEL